MDEHLGEMDSVYISQGSDQEEQNVRLLESKHGMAANNTMVTKYFCFPWVKYLAF